MPQELTTINIPNNLQHSYVPTFLQFFTLLLLLLQSCFHSVKLFITNKIFINPKLLKNGILGLCRNCTENSLKIFNLEIKYTPQVTMNKLFY